MTWAESAFRWIICVLGLCLFLAGCVIASSDEKGTAVPTETNLFFQATTPPVESVAAVPTNPPPATRLPPLTDLPTNEPTAATIQPFKRLIICTLEPPVPLHPYADVTTSNVILQALNDGPVDYVHFAYQSVLLANLPTLEAGTVWVEPMPVSANEPVFNRYTGQIEPYPPGEDTTMIGMVARFRLRPDATWSDGTPITAHDSVYAYRKLADSQIAIMEEWLPTSQRLFALTSRYYALDDQTVEWAGLPGYVSADFSQFFFPPLPRHLGVGLDTEIPLVGSGPFQFQEWLPGQHLVAIRNSFYFRTDEGLPHLEEVEFRFFEPPFTELLADISKAGCHLISRSITSAMPMET